MNNIQVFNNPEFGDIRTVEIDGEPWFVGKDVADNLGYQNGSRDINSHVDEEDRQNYQNGTFESNRGLTIINESGLYSLILSSKLPSARRFKHWVTSEVLPAIRKTGAYVQQEVKVPDISPELIVRCAEIISASPTDKILYVLEILKHIIPDLGNSVSAEVTKAPRLSQAGYTVVSYGTCYIRGISVLQNLQTLLVLEVTGSIATVTDGATRVLRYATECVLHLKFRKDISTKGPEEKDKSHRKYQFLWDSYIVAESEENCNAKI